MTKASDNAFPSLLITEGTEPSAPAAGKQRLYIDSTSHKLKRTDSSGVDVTIESTGGAGVGGEEMDYVEFTSPVGPTATTEATANTVVTGTATAFDGSTVVYVEFFAPNCRADVGAAGRAMTFWLYDGSSSIGNLAVITSASTSGNRAPVHAFRRLTPSNATHTYSIRASVTAGTGVIDVGAGGAATQVPGFIRITKK